MKKKFDGHIMLKQQLDDNTLKLYDYPQFVPFALLSYI